MTTAPGKAGGQADPGMSVAAEMEAVFARLPHAVGSAPYAPPAKPAAVRKSDGWRWAASFVVAVLIAAGVLIFMARPIPVISLQPQQREKRTASVVVPATTPVAVAQQMTAPSVATVPKPTHVERPKPSQIIFGNPGRCPAGATEAWCRRAEVVEADDRLREAYDEAVRAGIERDTLVEVRDDWARLRGRANRNPEALIRGYGVLTRQLYDELQGAPQ